MQRSAQQLRSDALRIWTAGLAAVRAQRLILETVAVDRDSLVVGGDAYRLSAFRRIAVVGAGKAASGMAQALEQAIGPALMHQTRLMGIVNVPADCLLPTDAIRQHVARPAAVNEPTDAGVDGARQILDMVEGLGPADLCICLISGGASALLPQPIAGFSLADKVELTRTMSAAGATIDQLNVVRRELSTIKGGGLARACRAGRLVSLIISDVLGDDLALVGSGPTAPRRPTPQAAIDVLESLQVAAHPAIRRAIDVLKDRAAYRAGHRPPDEEPPVDVARNEHGCHIRNYLLANNATAVDAAGIEAERLGYSHAMISATSSEGPVEGVAQRLVEMARRMCSTGGPDCLIWGGEPTVQLAPIERRGRGGRNQQLALAVLAAMQEGWRLALVSGGTDGEDGPTNAAGALVDDRIAAAAQRLGLDPHSHLSRNDAYGFFEQTGGLLVTGPTHTNVCDLRIMTVSRQEDAREPSPTTNDRPAAT